MKREGWKEYYLGIDPEVARDNLLKVVTQFQNERAVNVEAKQKALQEAKEAINKGWRNNVFRSEAEIHIVRAIESMIKALEAA